MSRTGSTESVCETWGMCVTSSIRRSLISGYPRPPAGQFLKEAGGRKFVAPVGGVRGRPDAGKPGLVSRVSSCFAKRRPGQPSSNHPSS